MRPTYRPLPAHIRAVVACREAVDLDRLEEGLARQLEAVREEKRSRQAQESALQSYVPKHPALGDQETLLAALHPAVRAAIDRGSKIALRALLREEVPGVYSFALFSPEFCQRVVEEVQHFSQWRAAALEAGTPGAAALPARTAPLAQAGLRDIAVELLDRVIRPIAAVLFDDVSLLLSSDPPHPLTLAAPCPAFVPTCTVRGRVPGLGPGLRRRLRGAARRRDPEPDAHQPRAPHGRQRGHAQRVPWCVPGCRSACAAGASAPHGVRAGRDFRGGELVFRGLRGSEREGHAERAVVLEAGRAVLHRGQHLHEVLPVKGGDRHAMILWSRSSRFRSSTCPCCMLHRRDERCICGPFWN